MSLILAANRLTIYPLKLMDWRLVKMIYGYVRVSTKEQNEDRQLVAMREFGVDLGCTRKQ